MHQIYNALIFLHENNIIHREFNIKNILINPKNYQIKIIDFGLSKHHSSENLFFSPQGNLRYRPPLMHEIFYDPYFADVWSFCLVNLSLFMKERITTKKTLKLLQNFKDKRCEIKGEIFGILMFLENTIKDENKKKIETISENGDSPLKDLKNYLAKC